MVLQDSEAERGLPKRIKINRIKTPRKENQQTRSKFDLFKSKSDFRLNRLQDVGDFFFFFYFYFPSAPTPLRVILVSLISVT